MPEVLPTSADAYDIAVEYGFKGDVDAWLESLKAPEGQNVSPSNYGGGGISRNRLLSGTIDPTKSDGRKGEHYLNRTSLELFYKNDSYTWVSLGTIGGGGGSMFYIQPSQPSDVNPFFWAQTGLGDGTGVTLWINT